MSRQIDRDEAVLVARLAAIERIRTAAIPAAQAIENTLQRGDTNYTRRDVDRAAHGARVTYHAWRDDAVSPARSSCAVWINDVSDATPERLWALAAEVAIWTAEIIRECAATEAGQIADADALIARYGKVCS